MAGRKESKVFHAEIWGLREEKYDWLEKHNIETTRWKTISPKSEFYLFVPRDEKLLEQYEKSPKVPDIFPVNSVGIVTARDNLTIKWSPDEIWRTVSSFVKMDPEIARLTYHLGKDVRDWKVELAQKDLKDSDMEKRNLVPILYRPFDMRFTYYTGRSRGFICMPRPEVMRHMLQDNLGLITPKQVKEEPGAFVSENIIGHKTVSVFDINYLFPLYTYPDTDKNDLFSHSRKSEKKKPNIKPEILNGLSDGYKKEPTPEETLYYIYAVLYSNTYRAKYAEFLKIDFPRIPFTKDYGLFKKMGEYGKELVNLHLLQFENVSKDRVESGGKRVEYIQPLQKNAQNRNVGVQYIEPAPKPVKIIAKFQGKNGNLVEKLKCEEKQRRVYINKDQYFEGVPNEVWEYQIGGYRVAEKWLKDRKGRRLSVDEITKYCRIVTALQKTIEVQKEIDKVYPEVEKDVIAFQK